MSDKYLIINADDFGMCRGSVLAVEDLLLDPNSPLTSSTVMTPCAWAPEACQFANKHPELGIGVHLTFTAEWNRYRWAPVNIRDTESLRDEWGFMYHSSDAFEKAAEIPQVVGEIKAQVERARVLGLTNPSHLDNHMGSLYGIETGRFELLQATLATCGEYGLPFRLPSKITADTFTNSMLEVNVDPAMVTAVFGQITAYADSLGVALPDYLIPNEWGGPQDDSYENFREYLLNMYANMPDGITETYLHPSLETEDLKGTSSVWWRRTWEYRIMKDPATKQHIEAHGIKLINYRDLAEMRKK